MKKLLLMFLLSTFVFSAFSQKYDSLIFKNGKKIDVTILGEGNDFIGYKLPNSSEWLITSKAELSRVVSKDGKTIYPKSSNNRKEEESPDNQRMVRATVRNNESRNDDLPTRNEQPTYRREVYLNEAPTEYSDNNSPPYQERRREVQRNYNSNYEEVVYLKNGSIIRGVVLEHIPNQNIKIRTADGSIFVYQTNEVERITKEAARRGNRINSFGGNGLQTGYKGIVELGYAIGVGDYDFDRFKFHFINGYQFNPFFSLGFGTGFHYYSEGDEDAWVIPFFADFRGNLLDNPISPYIALGFGYSFDASNDFEGLGVIFNPTIGVSFKVAEKTAINVGIGYDLQRVKGLYDSSNLGAFSINAGISF